MSALTGPGISSAGVVPPAVRRVALVLPFLLTALIYQGALSGPFLFDDFLNIVDNELLDIDTLALANLRQAAFSIEAGPLMRPVSMLSLTLTRYAFGLDPYYFKLINLIIHLVTGAAILWLTRLLLVHLRLSGAPISATTIYWTALTTATLWLVHPLNLTAVVYAVQRMTSLSALFLFFGLAFYLRGRLSQRRYHSGGWIYLLASVVFFLPLSALSKETGLLMPAFLVLIEGILLRYNTLNKRQQHRLFAFHALFIGVPILLAITIFVWVPQYVVAGYPARGFTLAERLLTEARIIWFYLHMIVLPNLQQLGLFHDDIPLSRSLFEPPVTLAAVTGLLALVSMAFALVRRLPVLAFGLAFFLVGHSMESTVVNLELVHEHRNYVPDFGILFALVYYALAARTRSYAILRQVGIAAFIVLEIGRAHV